jgi:hypothetical protein
MSIALLLGGCGGSSSTGGQPSETVEPTPTTTGSEPIPATPEEIAAAKALVAAIEPDAAIRSFTCVTNAAAVAPVEPDDLLCYSLQDPGGCVAWVAQGHQSEQTVRRVPPSESFIFGCGSDEESTG